MHRQSVYMCTDWTEIRALPHYSCKYPDLKVKAGIDLKYQPESDMFHYVVARDNGLK